VTEFNVANVVGRISYQQEFDLEALAEAFSSRDEIADIKYEPEVNPWLQTQFNPEKIYVAFYRTGKCSIPGCKSIEHFNEISMRVNDVMRDIIGFSYEPKSEISNIVVTADLGSQIPLEMLAIELGMDKIEYEPEQFPALLYRGSDYVILVFSSGKFLCTGLTEIDKIRSIMDEMSSRIEEAV
jgi:transcription initiation factor TFIID TATA-box-binding protein